MDKIQTLQQGNGGTGYCSIKGLNSKRFHREKTWDRNGESCEHNSSRIAHNHDSVANKHPRNHKEGCRKTPRTSTFMGARHISRKHSHIHTHTHTCTSTPEEIRTHAHKSRQTRTHSAINVPCAHTNLLHPCCNRVMWASRTTTT